MEERLRRVRERVEQEKGDRSVGRYSEELQREAVECWREGLEQGLLQREVATALGVDRKTLRHWSGRCGLRPVEILELKESRISAPSGRVVVSPGGLRVEGLDLEEIATLLRVLG